MNIALDLGAHACRSLRGSRAGLASRRFRSLAAWLPDGERHRTWLERHDIPCLPCDGHLAVIGEHAEEIAGLFPVPYQDLLLDGKVSFVDAVARQLIALVIESLVPPAAADGDVCGFTLPGHQPGVAPADRDFDRRLEFTSRLLRLRGYEPCPVNPAVALVLAGLEAEKYSGIGICLGASGCDLALAHRGAAAVIRRTDRGGRWIDEEFARRTGRICTDLVGERIYDVESARRYKEAALPARSNGDDARLFTELNRRWADDLAHEVGQLVAANPLLVRFAQPLTIVLGGGPARTIGFDDLFREAAERTLPSGVVGTIRQEPSSEFDVARGCLIQATLVGQSRQAA